MCKLCDRRVATPKLFQMMNEKICRICDRLAVLGEALSCFDELR